MSQKWSWASLARRYSEQPSPVTIKAESNLSTCPRLPPSGQVDMSVPTFNESAIFSPYEYGKRAAIMEFDPDLPAELAEGLAKLQVMHRPLKMPQDRWSQMLEDGFRLVKKFGWQAHELGWSATALFGFHRDMPRNGTHASGLVPSIAGNVVIAISPNTAAIMHKGGVITTYYRSSMPVEQIPLWELKNV